MDIEKIKQLSNPYYPISPKITTKEFVGRELYIELLMKELYNYEKTSKLKNILISGEKSVGKSTILNRYKDILIDNNFIVYETELLRDANPPVDEFEFFKDLFDELFRKYAPPEGEFFDSEQTEIWYSLTSDTYTHESDFKERKLAFPTQYSNKKKSYNEKLSYKQIEADFGIILNELLSPRMDFKGLAILIDEFQELSNNVFLLDTLRKLSENLVGLIIIGAGIPKFLNDQNFEKFIRNAVPITLKNLNRAESLELMFKPVQLTADLSRYEVEKLFDQQTVMEILDRTFGNPLHIKILCAELFDYFQNNSTSIEMSLNRHVMDKVMEYYCNMSDKSRRIRNALESCTKEQLEVFSRLYYYEGFTIRASILDELAFNSIQNYEVNTIKKKRIGDFLEIYDLGLFELSGDRISINELDNYTFNELAQVSYRFIGDPIDKMYASYFFEDLTNKPLNTPEIKDFDHLLALKLSFQLAEAVKAKKIPLEYYTGLNIGKIEKIGEGEYKSNKDIEETIEKLSKYKSYNDTTLESRKTIMELASKLDFVAPAMILSLLELEGYYLLVTNVSIRGKNVLLYNYYLIKGSSDTIFSKKADMLNYSEYFQASLDEYNVKVNWMALYWIPKQPLLLIYFVDIDTATQELARLVKERKFEDAAKKAELIFNLNLKLRENTFVTDVRYYNNLGFCLINVCDYTKAEQIFSEIEDKYMLSKINLAFIFQCTNKVQESKKKLKNLLKKKLVVNEDAAFLHLALMHKELKPTDKIAENILVANIICWNLALIAAQEKEDISVINSFLKQVRLNKFDKYFDQRVRYWINYYRGETNLALESARNLLKNSIKNHFIYSDIQKDIEIFQKES